MAAGFALSLAIDATAGERERGSLEPLLTVPVPRAQLIFGKILATCAYMVLTLTLTVTVFAILVWRHVNPGILVLIGGTVYMVLM